MDVQDEARLLAVGQKVIGTWLEALLVPSLGLYLGNKSWGLLLAYVWVSLLVLSIDLPVSATRRWEYLVHMGLSAKRAKAVSLTGADPRIL